MSTAENADPADLAKSIAERAKELELSVAVAESLTGGQVCAALAAAPDGSQWFAGGVVAYHRDVKYHLLGVPPGPVVSAEAAAAMAEGARRTHEADVAVSLTGAGGPDPQDGREPGTVFVGIAAPDGVETFELHLPGDPSEVCAAAVAHALTALDKALTGQSKMSG